MPATKGAAKRKKVNFMIDHDVLKKLHEFVSSGNRSDFINGALGEALVLAARKKASDNIDIFRKTHKWHLTDAQIRKARDYGR